MADVEEECLPPKKYFSPLKWRDFIRSIQELINQSSFHKSQAFEIFAVGIASIAQDKIVEDKVQGMDVVLENLRPYVEQKPRWLMKSGRSIDCDLISEVALLCRILSQEETRMNSDVLQTSADGLVELDLSRSGFILMEQIQPQFYKDITSAIQHAVKLDCLSDARKLSLVQIIERIEGNFGT